VIIGTDPNSPAIGDDRRRGDTDARCHLSFFLSICSQIPASRRRKPFRFKSKAPRTVFRGELREGLGKKMPGVLFASARSIKSRDRGLTILAATAISSDVFAWPQSASLSGLCEMCASVCELGSAIRHYFVIRVLEDGLHHRKRSECASDDDCSLGFVALGHSP